MQLRALFAAFVFVGLMASLFALAPPEAEAALVHMTGGGVTLPSDSAGEPFDLVFRIDVPAGEHIPLDFARVLVANAPSSLSGTGVLNSGIICDADTAGTVNVGTGVSVQITSIKGATATPGTYVGTGYDVAVGPGLNNQGQQGPGYGFQFTNPSSIFAGSGSGYGGGGTKSVQLEVTVRVTGCDDEINYGGGPEADLRVQILIGSTTAQLKSFPVDVTFSDPTQVLTNFSDTTVTSSETDVTVSQSGVDTSVGVSFTSTGNLVHGFATGTSFNTPVAGTPGGIVSTGGTLKSPLPDGSKLVVTARTDGIDPANPPYGIDPTASTGAFPNPPGIYLDFSLFVTGKGAVPVDDYITPVTIVVDLPDSYFTKQGITPWAANFIMRGFETGPGGTGGIKLSHPAVVGYTDNGALSRFTVVITEFSSFAGYAANGAGGGGGGGGAGQATVTDTQTVTPITQTTTTAIEYVTETAPSPGGTYRTPGAGMLALVAALALAVAVRRRL